MNSIKYLSIFLLIAGCTAKKEFIEPATLWTKNVYLNQGLHPIEFSRENEVVRIWINRSSSTTDVLTIIRDTSGNYAE
jgi:hypothetical protein